MNGGRPGTRPSGLFHFYITDSLWTEVEYRPAMADEEEVQITIKFKELRVSDILAAVNGVFIQPFYSVKRTEDVDLGFAGREMRRGCPEG